jgi:hypothetical protein
MKSIITTLALAALLISAPNVMAGGNSYNAVQQEGYAQQARQKAMDQRLAKIEKESLGQISAIPEEERAGMNIRRTNVAGRFFCLDKC